MQNFIIIVNIDNNSNVRMEYTYIDLLHINKPWINSMRTPWPFHFKVRLHNLDDRIFWEDAYYCCEE
jgi:hypothetical protein